MNKRILLAEDDSNLGNLLSNYLAAKDYEASLFINGRSALEGFSSGSFDLCILDIMMPEMDGLALAKELRYIEPAIQIIFLTAKTQLLTYKDLSIKLTTKESELLELLCCHRNEILERNYALRTIWIDDNISMPGAWMFTFPD